MVKNPKIFEKKLKDRYEWMCTIDAYDKEHVAMTDYAVIGSGRPFLIAASKGALI